MHVIRILLAGPRLLAELVARLIDSAPDVEIVGTVPIDDTLMAHARELKADAVVLGAPVDASGDWLDAMLYEFPTVKLLALTPDAHRATLYELRPHRTPLGELSRDRLLDAIRTAVATRSEPHASR